MIAIIAEVTAWSDVLDLLLDHVFELSLFLVPLLLRIFVPEFFGWINIKLSNESFRNASAKLEALVIDAVDEVDQLDVRTLKSKGKWDLEAAHSAKERAQEIVHRHLGPEGLLSVARELKVEKAVVEGRVRTMIEAYIHRKSKMGGPGDLDPTALEKALFGAVDEPEGADD